MASCRPHDREIPDARAIEVARIDVSYMKTCELEEALRKGGCGLEIGVEQQGGREFLVIRKPDAGMRLI